METWEILFLSGVLSAFVIFAGVIALLSLRR